MSVLILASGSETRAAMLRNAGVEIDVVPARIDEESLRQSLLADGASGSDIADALAENKARKIAIKYPESLVLGCDQILELDGAILSKPDSPDAARRQLERLRASTHRLISAAVLYYRGQPVWRRTATARMTMRNFSDGFLTAYLAQNWDDLRHSVGCYQIEGPGIRLFSWIEGDYFAILGLPLLELLDVLTRRKDIDG
ncbi:MAG: septum formation protein [Rhodobacteraceae bacterium HLUCCA12]|nr:MAG: septum formation protein [Rhodobacteraceae bacterium HLUCCA12]